MGEKLDEILVRGYCHSPYNEGWRMEGTHEFYEWVVYHVLAPLDDG